MTMTPSYNLRHFIKKLSFRGDKTYNEVIIIYPSQKKSIDYFILAVGNLVRTWSRKATESCI